jgi:predicted TPR repeat methyltransferase
MEKMLPYESFASAVAAARAARKNGDSEGAAKIYNLIPAAFPEKKHAVTVAADGLIEAGYWTEAVAMLETALRAWPYSALYLSAIADAYRKIDDYPRAAAYLQRYLDHDPRNPEAWLNLARLHDLAGNYSVAETAYANALQRDPTSDAAAIGRGDVLFQLGRAEEAIACYRRAVAIQPQNPTALFALGSALMTTGAQAEGHDYLRQSLEIDPGNARAHINLGLTYFNTGNADAAATAARNALLIDDQLQIAQVLLGTALAEQGDLDGAAASLSRAVTTGSHNAEALFTLADVQTALENRPAAELALQRVLADAPDNLEARHLLAALHREALSAPKSGYAREAFDRIARQFDNRQLRFRHYRAPTEIAALIEEYQPDRRTIKHLADVGCGTGLVAATLHDTFAVENAVGIDISPGMIEIARGKNVYSEFVLDDAARGIAVRRETFDVITAGDLFPYLGGLTEFMVAARTRLASGGLLAYSIQVPRGGETGLNASGRYVHAPSYVEEVAGSAGLRPVASRTITLARVLGQDVPGLVGLLQA